MIRLLVLGLQITAIMKHCIVNRSELLERLGKAPRPASVRGSSLTSGGAVEECTQLAAARGPVGAHAHHASVRCSGK